MLRTETLALSCMLAALVSGNDAQASPGPPPPQYVSEIAKHIVPNQTATSFDRYAGDLAPDLSVWTDGTRTALGKEAWLAIERRRLGKVDRRVLGYVTGYDSILVIDRFDDRSGLPDTPGAVFDPRYKIRAVHYDLGTDHLIHTIRITQTEGVLQTPS